MSEEWSSPDSDGICILKVDIGVKRTLKGRRKRKAFMPNSECIQVWPQEWRTVLVKWFKGGGTRKKYESLMRAGEVPISLRQDVFDALLKNGLIEIEEVRAHGRWLCTWVVFVEAGALRDALGLDDVDAIADQCTQLSKFKIENKQIEFVFSQVMKSRNKTALKRGELLKKLDAWHSEARVGSRREFALYARGDTKGITTTEWKWMSSTLTLEYFNISKHTPMLLMKGPVRIRLNHGLIDVSAAHGFIGITPETILSSMIGLEGRFNRLMLLENQTTFEHVAKNYGHTDLVVWLPGYPPSWWQECMRMIAEYVDCHAMIAADPDPSGIEIALITGKILDSCGIAWEPWHMSVSDLNALSEHKQLTEHDRKKLISLSSREMPTLLRELADEMVSTGVKGEQEGILM